MVEPFERIAFALDVPTAKRAAELIEQLSPCVGAFKLGLELFIATGGFSDRRVIDHQLSLTELTDRPFILDLKLHDIPETVARAVKAAGERGFRMLTVHVQQERAIEMALRAAEPYGITLLGVTLLTSMDRKDCEDMEYAAVHPGARAMGMAVKGHRFGLRGFVCSPQEVGALKGRLTDSLFLVPGIRPAGVAGGDDQKRVGTAAQAVADGAGLVVVGRTIRDAPDPAGAARAVAAEIAGP